MGSWTRTPPSEPGWYWQRGRDSGALQVVRIRTSSWGHIEIGHVDSDEPVPASRMEPFVEWWPTPIPEPGDEA